MLTMASWNVFSASEENATSFVQQIKTGLYNSSETNHNIERKPDITITWPY